MKKYFYSLILACMALPSFAQQTKLQYTIAPWQNNKKAAASLTFDDAINGQFTIALPLLNKYGFKATFFIITTFVKPQLGGWQLVKDAAAGGHEIASHTLTHPHLHALPADSIIREFVACNDSTKLNVPGQQSITMAYPYGDGGGATDSERMVRKIAAQYYIGARAVRNNKLTYNAYNFAAVEDDYYRVNSDMIADSASMADLGKHLDETIAAGGWYVPLYHGIENGWIIVKKEIFEQHLKEFDKRKDVLWIAPFANVIKYHKERNSAQLTTLAEDAHTWELSLKDTLANSTIWNEPLTINLAQPAWKIKSIQQAGKTIPFAVKDGMAIFNAVPGDNNIVIKKT